MADDGTCLAARVKAAFRSLPISAVEGRDRWLEPVSLVKTAPIYAPGVRVGPRLIEALDAAMAAEQVLGGAGSETIGS